MMVKINFQQPVLSFTWSFRNHCIEPFHWALLTAGNLNDKVSTDFYFLFFLFFLEQVYCLFCLYLLINLSGFSVISGGKWLLQIDLNMAITISYFHIQLEHFICNDWKTDYA